MKGYELFGVVVRTLGLWLVVQGFIALPAGFFSMVAFISGAAELVAGLVLFFGADGFVRAAYHRVAYDELEPPISK